MRMINKSISYYENKITGDPTISLELAEQYYMKANICAEITNIQKAIKYYIKCLEVDSNETYINKKAKIKLKELKKTNI